MDSGAKYVVLNELLVLIALVMLFLFVVKSDILSSWFRNINKNPVKLILPRNRPVNSLFCLTVQHYLDVTECKYIF